MFHLTNKFAARRLMNKWVPALACMGVLAQFVDNNNRQPSLAEDQKHRTYATRGSLREFHRYYREGEKLGEGTFAVVKRGVDLSSKEQVAIKEIDKEKSDEECRANEVIIMEKVGQHRNLVALHNVYESENVLFVIQDLAEGGELFERIVKNGELSEKDASKLFKGAVEAVAHLHERHIAHLDIKPENLLLKLIPKKSPVVEATSPSSNTSSTTTTTTTNTTSPSTSKNENKLQKRRRSRRLNEEKEEIVALADFGLAIQDETETFDMCVGTPAYWAPEMVRREPFGLAVDMWALGCVLYILLCGVHPFDPTGDAPEAQILAKVATGDYYKGGKEYLMLSDAAKDLIRHLLDPDALRRYNAKQTLQHPWLTSEEVTSDEPLSSQHMSKLSGFRVLTLIKTGMRDMLRQAENDLFEMLDENGDGYISREELTTGLKVVGFDLSEAEVDAFLKLVDTDGDEVISRKEFSDVLAKRFEGDASPVTDHASLQDLATLFKAYDKDQDGYISADDIHHVLALLGTSVTRSVVQNEMAQMTDAEGLVSFAQFVKHVREMEKEKQQNRDSAGVSNMSSVLKLRDKRDLLRSRR